MRATEIITDDEGTGDDLVRASRCAPTALVGGRLAILDDRVELRDGTDVLRRSVSGSDITDVVVQIRADSAVLIIETSEGPVISARGLRPEQAESARSLIARTTRPPGPVPIAARRAEEAITPVPPDPSPPEDIDADDVLSTLGDLFVLGILTTGEYEAMLELTERLFGADIALSA